MPDDWTPDGVDLLESLYAAMSEADRMLCELPCAAERKATAERDYRVAKGRRILHERTTKGTAVSIVQDVVKGYKDIADLSFARDCAEAEYSATLEALLWNKKKVDVIRELVAREYSGAHR